RVIRRDHGLGGNFGRPRRYDWQLARDPPRQDRHELALRVVRRRRIRTIRIELARGLGTIATMRSDHAQPGVFASDPATALARRGLRLARAHRDALERIELALGL